MYQRRFLQLLLAPSLLSSFVVTLLSVSYMAYAGWQYVQDNQYFYDFLFGVYGAQTYLWEHPFASPPWLAAFFSGSLVYFAFVVTTGLIVGALVYGVLQTLSAIRKQKADFSQTLTVVSIQRDAIVEEFITRTALRVIALMGWGLYALFFTSTIMEALTMNLHSGIDAVQAGRVFLGSLQLVAGGLFLLVAVHVHVYFLRLVRLRARAAYGDSSIEAAELSPPRQ